jgi:hypothetical protein
MDDDGALGVGLNYRFGLRDPPGLVYGDDIYKYIFRIFIYKYILNIFIYLFISNLKWVLGFFFYHDPNVRGQFALGMDGKQQPGPIIMISQSKIGNSS